MSGDGFQRDPRDLDVILLARGRVCDWVRAVLREGRRRHQAGANTEDRHERTHAHGWFPPRKGC